MVNLHANPNPDTDAQQQPTPADRASKTGLRAAVVAFVALGLSSWLGLFSGTAFFVGVLVWVVATAVSISFASAALRNWFSSVDSPALRRRAWSAIAIDALSIFVFSVFIIAVTAER